MSTWMRWVGHIYIGEGGGAYRIFIRKPKEETTWRTQVYIRGSLGSGMGDMDLIDLAQNRDRWQALVNVVMIGTGGRLL
jgi:hypothetical protein